MEESDMERDLPVRLDEITLRNDYAFKKIFGTEENKDIMIAFVSLAIGMKKEDFADVRIENTDLPQEFFEDKKGRLDIKIKLKSGAKIDVEMQNIYLNHYPKRSLYYWSELFLENFKKGDEYANLNKTIVINILNEPFPLSDKLHSTFKILETEERTLFDDSFELHFFNLSKLKEDVMLHSMEEIEKWLLFIKTNKDKVRDELASGNNEMQKANEALKHFYLTDEDRRAYLIVSQAMSDRASIIGESTRTGIEQGIKQGIQQGIKKGIQQGIKKGIQQGIQQGEYQSKMETAKKCLNMNMPIETISSITGLTEKEISILLENKQ